MIQKLILNIGIVQCLPTIYQLDYCLVNMSSIPRYHSPISYQDLDKVLHAKETTY